MATAIKTVSVEEFEVIAALPENHNRRMEYIGGEMVEMVSNNYSSYIGARVLTLLNMFVISKNLGWMTGEAGGYKIAGERYMPDVAFVSKQKQAKPSHETWNSTVPDLVVEVLSPTDRAANVSVKISNYLSAGAVVWLVDTEDQQVSVHVSGQAVQTFGIEDTLTGGTILPDFELAVATIFEIDSTDDDDRSETDTDSDSE